MTTPFHSQYWAHELTLRSATGSIESLSRSIAGARVDLNPHQVDAALFALRSPLTHGVVLADEVGLRKTIEAGIVITQRWAERRRRILLVVPATLRKLVVEYIPFTRRVPVTQDFRPSDEEQALQVVSDQTLREIAQATERFDPAVHLSIRRAAGGAVSLAVFDDRVEMRALGEWTGGN
jgi:SNF2 family DNA or RNA helicase